MAKRTKAPSLDHIAEPLRHLAVPIAELVPDPKNTRKHDAANLAAIKGALRRFVQRQPLVVQRAGMIVRAGNGRVRAAIELGWTHIAAVIVDEDDASAIAFAIADNRTAELADWNDPVLAELMREIEAGDPELSQMLADLEVELGVASDDAPNSVRILAQGIPENVIDIDTYGLPWKHYGEVVSHLRGPTTVFLTIGIIGQSMNLERTSAEKIGVGSLSIPPGAIANRLNRIAVSYCLTSCYGAGIIIEEAVEAISSGNARYIGVRLKKREPEVSATGSPHTLAAKEQEHG